MKKMTFFLSFLFLVLFSLPAYATNVADAETISMNAQMIDSVLPLIKGLSGIIVATSVLMLVYAGFKYATSQGDPKSVESAKSQIVSSGVGLMIAMMAMMVTQIFSAGFSGEESITKEKDITKELPKETPSIPSVELPKSTTPDAPFDFSDVSIALSIVAAFAIIAFAVNKWIKLKENEKETYLLAVASVVAPPENFPKANLEKKEETPVIKPVKKMDISLVVPIQKEKTPAPPISLEEMITKELENNELKNPAEKMLEKIHFIAARADEFSTSKKHEFMRIQKDLYKLLSSFIELAEHLKLEQQASVSSSLLLLDGELESLLGGFEKEQLLALEKNIRLIAKRYEKE